MPVPRCSIDGVEDRLLGLVAEIAVSLKHSDDDPRYLLLQSHEGVVGRGRAALCAYLLGKLCHRLHEGIDVGKELVLQTQGIELVQPLPPSGR